ncbi:DUF6527 family protein [Paraburkholderia sp. C35]|uniref:DUF6527 family protein n=1 Tax=Paraburkholderia sp. C35 TaxID=2126993 RepID=UPI000D69F132|nr:DUF6527 family protein [Paraburkholderia sp. C35]
MKLVELNPEFVRFLPELICQGMHRREVVSTFAEAQGIRFTSPTNPEQKVCVPFRDRGAPADENMGIQWGATGSSFADLTLSPSIDMSRGGGWHGFITDGEVR